MASSSNERPQGAIPAADDLRDALAALQYELDELRGAAQATDPPLPPATPVAGAALRALPTPAAGQDHVAGSPIARSNQRALMSPTRIDALVGPQESYRSPEIGEVLRLADRLASAQAELGSERGLRMAAEARCEDYRLRLEAAVSKVETARDMAREACEHAAFLEGRVSSLEDTLDQVVHSSLLARWKWRRALRRGQAPAGS